MELSHCDFSSILSRLAMSSNQFCRLGVFGFSTRNLGCDYSNTLFSISSVFYSHSPFSNFQFLNTCSKHILFSIFLFQFFISHSLFSSCQIHIVNIFSSLIFFFQFFISHSLFSRYQIRVVNIFSSLFFFFQFFIPPISQLILEVIIAYVVPLKLTTQIIFSILISYSFSYFFLPIMHL